MTWLIASFRSGSRPFHHLAEALVPLMEPRLRTDASALETQARTVARQLRDGELQLTDLADRILARSDDFSRPAPPRATHVATTNGRRLLLIADQFEELYALCPDPSTRRAFLDLLLGPLTLPHTPTPTHSLTLLLSLRADFTAQALSHRPLADAIQRGGLVLGPMTRQELRQAIEEPTRGRGAIFEPGLVQRLLDNVGDEPATCRCCSSP